MKANLSHHDQAKIRALSLEDETDAIKNAFVVDNVLTLSFVDSVAPTSK